MPGFYAVGSGPVGSTDSTAILTTIAASVGAALATGLPAAVVSQNASRVNATVGVGAGAGLRATVSTQRTINATPGAANAVGMRASVTTAGAINCMVGVGQATGARATITSTRVVNTLAGVAQATGLDASITHPTPVTLPTFPEPNLVVAGVRYGPTGVEYTGSLIPSSGNTGASASEIAAAVWANPQALSLITFLAYKDA